MKKILAVISILLVSITGFMFAGCSVAKPTLTIQGNRLTWAEVQNASKYTYFIDSGEELETDKTYIDLSSDTISSGNHTVTVKGVCETFFISWFCKSEGETSIDFYKLKPVSLTRLNQMMTWTQTDEKTEQYKVYLNDNVEPIVTLGAMDSLQVDLSILNLQVGQNQVKVASSSSQNKVVDATPSVCLVTKLASPVVNSELGGARFSWEKVDGADYYDLYYEDGRYIASTVNFTYEGGRTNGDYLYVVAKSNDKTIVESNPSNTVRYSGM